MGREGGMMGDSLSPPINKDENAWQEWHIKGLVMASISLQVMLLLLATFRKRTANPFVQAFIYVVYWLSNKVSDAAFVFIIGAQLFKMYKVPFGLWAALMLVHRTGREQLTAFSLEENESWLSHFFSLLWQCVYHFLFMREGLLQVPTIIMLILFLVRLLAQTLCLRLGAKDMTGFIDLILSSDTTSDDLNWDPVGRTNDLETVRKARRLIRSSLRLIIGGTCDDRGARNTEFQRVRNFFCDINDCTSAFRIMEKELNFIYKSFYTEGTILKLLHGKNSLLYASFRSCESLFCVGVLISFLSSYEIQYYYTMTCVLLWVTMVLEILSLLTTVFSDWTIVALHEEFGWNIRLPIIPYSRPPNSNAQAWLAIARVMFRWWSETISQFNFLHYSIITEPLRKPMNYMRFDVLTGITNQITSFKFVSSDWYTDEIGTFIHGKLREKREDIISSLTRWQSTEDAKRKLLVWHIVTEVLYNSDDQNQSDDCKYSKVISDYVACLLYMKPQFTSRLRGNTYLDGESARETISKFGNTSQKGGEYNACLRKCYNEIYGLNTANCEEHKLGILWIEISEIKASLLQKDVESPWTTISNKWIEILVYVARECDALEHVRGLCQGGELISLVWLLAFHCGFFEGGISENI